MEAPTYAVAAVRQSQQASQYTESPRHGRHKRPWPKNSLVRARVDEICRGTRREQEKVESRVQGHGKLRGTAIMAEDRAEHRPCFFDTRTDGITTAINDIQT